MVGGMNRQETDVGQWTGRHCDQTLGTWGRGGGGVGGQEERVTRGSKRAGGAWLFPRGWEAAGWDVGHGVCGERGSVCGGGGEGEEEKKT